MPEFDHEAVNHSAAEYVREQAHTNGIESFWAVLKRANERTRTSTTSSRPSTCIAMSLTSPPVTASATWTRSRRWDYTAEAMVGNRLTYAALIADNGLASGARA